MSLTLPKYRPTREPRGLFAGLFGPRAPHPGHPPVPPPHGPGAHPMPLAPRHPHPPHGEPMSALARHLEELRWMGASEDDLHAVIDSYCTARSGCNFAFAFEQGENENGADCAPGQTDPFTRAYSLFQSCRAAERDWRDSLRGRRVVAAGDFPPHLLDELLADGIRLTQIHPPDPEGYAPPHFYHLAAYGLRGVTTLQELAEAACDVMMMHGAPMGTQIRVAPIVPLVLRMFPNAEPHLLEADHVAPHMMTSIPDSGFSRIPILL